MSYRKLYPKNLGFDLQGANMSVSYDMTQAKAPDIWAVKYLFDKGKLGEESKVWLRGKISKSMALRLHFIREIFPTVEFLEADGSKAYLDAAADIIAGVGSKYVSYGSMEDFRERGTKPSPESIVEKELAENLETLISDFAGGTKVQRQYPANIFSGRPLRESNRLTNKLWIDMVSVNKSGEVSPIELKVGGNIPLDLFAQGLDYGVFCLLFRRQILRDWGIDERSCTSPKVSVYYVGEAFHPALVGRDEDPGLISIMKPSTCFNLIFHSLDIRRPDLRIEKASCLARI